MASPPSSALAGAAVSGVALAGVVADLAGSLPVATTSAQAAMVAAREVRLVTAPRIVAVSDVGAVAGSLVAAVQALARSCAPADAASALYVAAAATQACAPTSASPVLTQVYGLARALCLSVEMACLGEAFVAEARTGFADRDAASAARVRVRIAYDGAADRIAALLGEDILAIFGIAAREALAYLVQEAATIQPLIRVQAAKSFPAAALAWSLYADPERAGELMARNDVGTPFHMPAQIEAVSPERR